MIYCLILEFVLFMYGLIALVSGKLSFRDKIVASGKTARIAGLILMASLPLTLVIETLFDSKKDASTTLLLSLVEILILLGSLAGTAFYVWLAGKKGIDPTGQAEIPTSKPAPIPPKVVLPEGITARGTRTKTEPGRVQTYIEYAGLDAESAKKFLQSQPRPPHDTCLVVETPQGVWGWDENGLYLEHLLSWQLDTDSANIEGTSNPMSASKNSALYAKHGTMDNFVIEVKCGACEHLWLDGIRYEGETVVRCPKCRELNKVKNTLFIF